MNELLLKFGVSLAVLGATMVTGEGFSIALGAVIGFWLREGEHQTMKRRAGG